MATYWGNSCSFGLRYVSWYKYLIVSLFFFHLGFWSGNLFLFLIFAYLYLFMENATLRINKDIEAHVCTCVFLFYLPTVYILVLLNWEISSLPIIFNLSHSSIIFATAIMKGIISFSGIYFHVLVVFVTGKYRIKSVKIVCFAR